jgi:hypothetical protein
MDFTPTFGRIEDKPAVEHLFAQQRDPFMRSAAQDLLQDSRGDNDDVDLCAIYEQTTGVRWNSLNQNPRGFCVGFGNAKMVTLAIAMMAHAGEISWPGADVAIEPIYGGARFEVGYQTYRNRPGGDGAVGAWAVEWLLKWGVLLKQLYTVGGQNYDYTKYSLDRCDDHGDNGVPDALEPTAREKPIQKAALVMTGEEAWKLIGALHPLVHCSNQGFSMQRGSDGICRAQGNWAHCAGWSGRFVLKNGTRVLRYDNSWEGNATGDGYLGSPVTIEGRNGPIYLNGNQFLVPLEIVERMCRNGEETYGLTGPLGFNQRRKLFLV